MSMPMDHYWRGDIARTLEEVKEGAQKNKYSCAYRPLLHIPLDNVVLDELHLMLRITGDGVFHKYQHVHAMLV